MKTGTLVFFALILSLWGFENVHAQSRKFINLNENWIIGEAKKGTTIKAKGVNSEEAKMNLY